MRSSTVAMVGIVCVLTAGCCKKEPAPTGGTPDQPVTTATTATATATIAAPPAVPAGAVTVGSRVMAPWSRQGSMYGGVVSEIYGKLGYVKFNDGDAGWALLVKMRPLGTPQPDPTGDSCSFGMGDKVKAPWSRTKAMFSGVVTEVYGKLARVDFLDGDQGWAPCAEMRAR